MPAGHRLPLVVASSMLFASIVASSDASWASK
jgi:hypothetical protein